MLDARVRDKHQSYAGIQPKQARFEGDGYLQRLLAGRRSSAERGADPSSLPRGQTSVRELSHTAQSSQLRSNGIKPLRASGAEAEGALAAAATAPTQPSLAQPGPLVAPQPLSWQGGLQGRAFTTASGATSARSGLEPPGAMQLRGAQL
ncbi:hypothetical protein WJX73_002864 [Symbiochloris irregularis]|uniref:Uncharacterized protein n=1 Tax=Symbiochloris irregularis TaxID=706552 RepID=A0AAW1PMD0_9CHLO